MNDLVKKNSISGVWLSKRQVAVYLNLSVNTINNLESKGLIHGRRIYLGSNSKKPIVRYSQEEIDELLMKRQRGRPRQTESIVPKM